MEGTTEEAGLTNAGVVTVSGARSSRLATQPTRFYASSRRASPAAPPGWKEQTRNSPASTATVRIDGTYAAGTRTIDALNGD